MQQTQRGRTPAEGGDGATLLGDCDRTHENGKGKHNAGTLLRRGSTGRHSLEIAPEHINSDKKNNRGGVRYPHDCAPTAARVLPLHRRGGFLRIGGRFRQHPILHNHH